MRSEIYQKCNFDHSNLGKIVKITKGLYSDSDKSRKIDFLTVPNLSQTLVQEGPGATYQKYFIIRLVVGRNMAIIFQGKKRLY